MVFLADIIWIKSLLRELRFALPLPKLYCDNLSVNQLVVNPILHSRSKHFKLDLHFVRDHALAKSLLLIYLPSQYQVANILTKPISRSFFHSFKCKLRVFDPSSYLRGMLV